MDDVRDDDLVIGGVVNVALTQLVPAFSAEHVCDEADHGWLLEEGWLR